MTFFLVTILALVVVAVSAKFEKRFTLSKSKFARSYSPVEEKSALAPSSIQVPPIPAHQWNAATDPLPPLQPMEYGFSFVDFEYYYVTATGYVTVDMSVPGYSFYSYHNLSAISVGGGYQMLNKTTSPAALVNYIDYRNPTNPIASARMLFSERECFYNAPEGGSGFPGYNYWQQQVAYFDSVGIPMYYEMTTCPDVGGTCLEYAVPMGNITFTLYFQNSTGYLLNYITYGHEYCCLDGSMCGVETCPDGSVPLLTTDYAKTSYDNYINFGDNFTWPTNYFDQPSCMYSATYGYPTSAPTMSSDSDSNDISISPGQLAAAIIVPVVVMSAIIIALFVFYWTPKVLRANSPLSKANLETECRSIHP